MVGIFPGKNVIRMEKLYKSSNADGEKAAAGF